MLEGSVKLVPQNHDNAIYCSQRFPQDGKINWSWPADRIHDFIRAQSSPYPGAFFELNGEELIVEKSSELDEIWLSTPGQVIKVELLGSVLVGCGENTVLLLERLSLNNESFSASKILNSFKLRLN